MFVSYMRNMHTMLNNGTLCNKNSFAVDKVEGRMYVEGESRGHSMKSCKFGWFTIYYNHIYRGKQCLLPWQIMYIIRVNGVFVMLSLCIHICKPFIDHITNMCKLLFTCYVLIFTTVHSERYLGTHLNCLNSIPPNYN